MPLKIVWRGGVAHLHGTVAGQRVRRSARTSDAQLAEQIRIETEARLARAHLYGVEAESTFADAVVLYLKAGKSNRYLAPLVRKLGKRRLAGIKPGDLKATALTLYPNATGATRNRSVIKPARAVINFAAEAGLCSPMKIKGYYEPRVERPAGDRAWIDAFRAHAEHRLGVLALFMFTTAARIGEAVNLGPEHLDLDNKRIVGPPGKNGDDCVYYLTDELVRELRLLEPRRVNYGRGPARLFGWAGVQGPRLAWHATCARAGIAYLSPHEAGRHGFGTETVVRARVDVVTAAKLGRWRDPTVLLRRYAHATGLDRMAEYVFGDTPVTRASGTAPEKRSSSKG